MTVVIQWRIKNMEIAEIIYGNESGSIIRLNNKEGKLLIEIVESYCKQNPRKKNAKRFLKQLDENLPWFQ